MLVKSAVSNEPLIELKLEGTLQLNPVECREFLDLIANSNFADYMVMRVGASSAWVKLMSRWGAAVRYGIQREFADEADANTVNKEKS